MLRRRGYHRTGPAAEAESAVFGVIPVTTGSLPHGAFHRADDAPGAEGRSARTLRACSHSSLEKAATSEILARRPLLPTTRPAASRRWQRP